MVYDVLVLLLSAVLASPEPPCDLPVLRTVDGDKFVAKTVSILAPSIIVTEETVFRLARVNTPEYDEKDYATAQETLVDLIGAQTVGITMIRREMWSAHC